MRHKRLHTWTGVAFGVMFPVAIGASIFKGAELVGTWVLPALWGAAAALVVSWVVTTDRVWAMRPLHFSRSGDSTLSVQWRWRRPRRRLPKDELRRRALAAVSVTILRCIRPGRSMSWLDMPELELLRERVAELEQEAALLREELWSQWECNHAEHCSNRWPHPEGHICCWELPSCLASPSAASAATRDASIASRRSF